MSLTRKQRTIHVLKFASVAVLAFGLTCTAFALDPRKAFSQYAQLSWSHQNGLAPKSVMSIAQTADGFLWLGTEQGLIRYDGVKMITFDERTAPELGDRFIRSLAADPDGSLWIGTMSGIARYKDGHFQDYRKETQRRVDVYDICADGQGGVWFSSDSGLRHMVHGVARIYTIADGLPADGITGIAQAADGTLWIGTTGGLAGFKSGRFTAYTGWEGFHDNAINALAAGAHGVVWLGMRNGMVGRLANGKIATWWAGASTRDKRIECLHEDRDGTLWLAIKKLGLVRMRGHDVEVLAKMNGLPSNSPDWIYEDRESSLWVGWADSGLSMFRDTKFVTFGKPEGLPSDDIVSVTQAAGKGLWIGTGDAGIAFMEGTKVKVLTKTDGLAENEVLALMQQRDGTLWVGSEAGRVTRIKDGHVQTMAVSKTLSPGVPAMVEDRGGEAWFGFDMPHGLSRWRNGHFEQVALDGSPRALAAAPDGSVWVASYMKGLAHISNGSTRVYTETDGLPSLALTSVYVDPQGAVWAGTALSGVVRWKDGKVTRYSTAQGLFDNAVAGMTEDDYGYLWMAGSRGIWRIRKQELDSYAEGHLASVHCDVYGYTEGLRAAETSFAAQPAISKDAGGRLWFATSGGLSMIDPGSISSNSAAPHVQLENVLFDGQQESYNKSSVRPPPGGGTLVISYTAASFVAPEQMQFRYRLQGADPDWVAAGSNRTATYSHLRPGRYHFEVQAANNDGVWSTNDASLDLLLRARAYQKPWFWLLILLSLGVSVWRVYAIRVRYLVSKNQRLEDTVLHRTAEVRAALHAAEIAKELLHEQATKDSLTGLWNRRAIFKTLDDEIVRCQKLLEPLCILMVDADHFKSINDTFGHLAGDLVIQTISQRLRAGLRKHEAIGRYGGEELLVLMAECPLSTGLSRAEELRAAIERTPVPFNGVDIRVTCSFGLAQLGTGRSSLEIVQEADTALYLAKKAGRNCVRSSQQENLPEQIVAVPCGTRQLQTASQPQRQRS